MAYDPNSWQAQMGALGEEIVKRLWEEKYSHTVKKTADTFASGASIVDFEIWQSNERKFFAEVKVQSAYPYGVEKAPCYSFPKSKIDAYINYGEERHEDVLLCVVDPSFGFIRVGTLFSFIGDSNCLMRKRKINGRKYPFEQYNNGLGGMCYYFHLNQFFNYGEINEEDRQKLLALLQNKTTYSGEPTPEIAPAPQNTESALELTPPQKQTKQRTDTKPDDMQNLIDKAVVTFGVPRKDFVTFIIKSREDQFNREMEPLRAMLA